jgi:hypothetical protein
VKSFPIATDRGSIGKPFVVLFFKVAPSDGSLLALVEVGYVATLYNDKNSLVKK